MEWSDQGVEGSHRFLQKIARISTLNLKKQNEMDEHKKNLAIKTYTNLIENFKFNLAIVELMKYADYVNEHPTKEGYSDLLKMISPFAPHLAEEMWEKLGNKGFISLEKWPKFDEKKISEELEQADLLIESTKSDIRDVLKLAKIESPRKITLFVADGWKYQLYNAILEELKKTRNVSDIMKKVMSTDLKKYGQDIQRMLPKLIQNPPQTTLDNEKEFKALKESEHYFEKEFNAKVEVVRAGSSTQPKARNALPGKPALLVE
jgi:leucyl-tRNA synthetase